jgi:hypothetical protein
VEAAMNRRKVFLVSTMALALLLALLIYFAIPQMTMRDI